MGEIVVQSSSLADGYLNAPEATMERFTPEGLLTRDLGFIRDGELYVTGRLDDLMSVAGRNIYARDLEAAVTGVPGVRAGRISIVDVERHGATSLVAVLEPPANHPELSLIASEIGTRIRASAGVTIDECLFLEQGRLPKTPSAEKCSVFVARELAADGKNLGVRMRPSER